jgi:hypothetical protein
LTTLTKNPQKTQRKIPKKIRNAIHNTTNDQIFSNKRIRSPPAPSPMAQNTKPRHGKDIKLLNQEEQEEASDGACNLQCLR